MAEKKPATKKAATTPKTGTKTSGAKKVGNSATAKAKTTKKPAPKKPKKPDWFKTSAGDYVVGTEDYRKIVEFHNKKTGSAYNTWRVQPAVFYTIHQKVADLLKAKK
jgi:hypothetical protein